MKKQKRFGCTNTNFITPHGLDEEGHYTTAYELALISNYALKNPLIAKIAKTKLVTIHINGYEEELANTNPLLSRVDGVDGLKTGFTEDAMYCVVTGVTRGDTSIIVVILGADNRTLRNKDDIALIEYSFSTYERVDLNKILQSEFKEWIQINEKRIEINKGIEKYLELELETCDENKWKTRPIKKDEIKDICAEIHALSFIDAPIEKGFIVGVCNLKIRDEIIDSLKIISKRNIEKKNIKFYFNDLTNNFINTLEKALKMI